MTRELEVLSRLDNESLHRCPGGADVSVASGGGIALWVQRDAEEP